ncbi:MAG: methyl-accepting chemotaxis protein [Verrucomicrobiota bacterium]
MFNLKLRGKIIGVAILAAAIPTALLALLVLFKQTGAKEQLYQKLEVFSQELVSTSARNVYDSCEVANEILRAQLRTNLNLAREVVESEGGISFPGPPVEWQAIDPAGRSVDVTLAELRIGTQPQPPVYDFDTPVLVVDEITNKTGATATIFQRMNTEGDMLRVATSVPQAALGLRATGTFLAHREPSGELNRVVKTILSGDDYQGLATVVDSWYLTNYTPIYSRENPEEVSGMLFVGLGLDTLPSLQENITKTRVGRHGGITILEGKGPLRGKVVLSRDQEIVGQSVNDLPDGTLRDVYTQVVEEAVDLRDGEAKSLFYDQPAILGQPAQRMILSYTYYAPWDWVICAKAPLSDFDQSQAQINAIFGDIQAYLVLGGALGMIIAVLVALLLAGRIANPISELTNVAAHIAKGDLEGARKRSMESTELRRVDQDRELAEHLAQQMSEQGRKRHGKLTASVIAGIKRVKDMDETSQLITTVRSMVLSLNTLVTKVKDSSVQLIATATEISATARQQESNVQNFSTSSNEIAAAVKEIDATSQELLGTMDHVTDVAGEAGSMAERGRERLTDMTVTIERLAKASSSISSKLSIINDKASNIGFVVTTISKVADQTNLLSLNAAIEAEQAGEFGSGFAVVAREIRRLADQTAEATLDIEDMVKEMQSAVSSGVMEMDKFTDEVRSGVEETERISSQFGEIIGQVQQLTPRFRTVYEGMQSQSKGATQIAKAMEQLTEIARQSSDSLREFNLASRSLRDALGSLRDEVATFKTIRQDLLDTHYSDPTKAPVEAEVVISEPGPPAEPEPEAPAESENDAEDPPKPNAK